ncbi:MAG: hypothetical protein AAFX99_24820, partial [Myxococcota bacterium]
PHHNNMSDAPHTTGPKDFTTPKLWAPDAFDMRPVRHIFVKDKCAWFDILDDLPQVASWVHSTSGEDIPEPF